jgi:DNA repair protein RadC
MTTIALDSLALLPNIGADSTTAQLLRVLAGDEAAELYRQLGRLRPVLDLIEDHTIEPLTRARLLALRELHERLASETPGTGGAIRGPEDARQVFAYMAALDREEMHCAFLTRRNVVLGIACIAVGGPDQVALTPYQIFKPAIRRNSVGLILSHVHPSGDATPSAADVSLTERISSLGCELGIKLLDHLIFAPGGGFYSFAQAGRLA